jgi:hypothetical protein
MVRSGLFADQTLRTEVLPCLEGRMPDGLLSAFHSSVVKDFLNRILSVFRPLIFRDKIRKPALISLLGTSDY